MIYLFVLAQLTSVTDRQTDGHRVPAISALMHSIARQKPTVEIGPRTHKSLRYRPNCNFITLMLSRNALIVMNALLSVNCFNFTFALNCSMRCVIVPLNQYADDDDLVTRSIARPVCDR